MSVEALLWAYQQPVSPPERFVLLTIGFMADPDGYAWPGIPYLAKRTGLTTRSVQRILRRLEAGKFIQRDARQSGKGDPDTNLYRLPEFARGGDTVSGGVPRSPLTHGHQGGDTGSPVIERLVKDKQLPVVIARAQEPELLEGEVPEWLRSLRKASPYKLSAAKETALIRSVSTLGCAPDRLMSAAESLASQWPYKQHKHIDMTLLSWLRRDGNGNGTAQTNGGVLGKTESRLTPANPNADYSGWRKPMGLQGKPVSTVDAPRDTNGAVPTGLLDVPPSPATEPRGKTAGD